MIAERRGLATMGTVIEAIAILSVGLIVALIYIGARVQAERERPGLHEEIEQLRELVARHEGRLQLAREKNWDDTMTGIIAEQLAETQGRLAMLTATTDAGSRQS